MYSKEFATFHYFSQGFMTDKLLLVLVEHQLNTGCHDEMERVMRLIGVSSVSELRPEHVRRVGK
jgi:hypothetical protein